MVLGGEIPVMGGIREPDLGHALHPGSGIGDGPAVGAGDEDVHFPTDLRGSGNGIEGRRLEAGVVVFGNDENGHVRTPSLRF